MDTSGENGASRPARALFFFPTCSALRAGRGLTKRSLAEGSKVDRGTLDKIESGKAGVTEEMVMRVFNCLNDHHYGGKLKAGEVINNKSANGKGS